MMNLNEALIRIKKAGSTNVRAVPMTGQDVQTGLYMIEVNDGGKWTAIMDGLPKRQMDGIIQQATNRVLNG